MFKRIGVFALMLSAAGAAFAPATALAQDRGGYYVANYHDCGRDGRREWRERERHERDRRDRDRREDHRYYR